MNGLAIVGVVFLLVQAVGVLRKRGEVSDSRPTLYGAITSVVPVGNCSQYKITVRYLDGTQTDWITDVADTIFVDAIMKRVRAGKPWFLIEPIEQQPEEPGDSWTPQFRWQVNPADPPGRAVDSLHLSDFGTDSALAFTHVAPYAENLVLTARPRSE